jgi:hypothetical protein
MLNNELVRMKMVSLGISTASLSAIAGINPNRVSLYVSGTRQLPNGDIERLDRTLADLTQLVRIAVPWPLSFKDVARIQELIARMKAGEFQKSNGHELVSSL